LYNALRVVGKDIADVRVVMSGAGAAGTAIMRLLLEAGVGHLVATDINGVVHRDRTDMDPTLRWIAEHTNPDGVTGTLTEVLVGADVFIGVSAPGLLDGSDVERMADDPIVFALANPEPEIDPAEATQYAAV